MLPASPKDRSALIERAFADGPQLTEGSFHITVGWIGRAGTFLALFASHPIHPMLFGTRFAGGAFGTFPPGGGRWGWGEGPWTSLSEPVQGEENAGMHLMPRYDSDAHPPAVSCLPITMQGC